MRRLLVLLMVTAAFAGCADTTGPSGEDGDDPILVTDPSDYENGTADGSHLHDYWGGREKVQIVDTAVSMTAGVGELSYTFRPMEGELVRPGTSVVRVVINWAEGTLSALPKGEPTLSVKTAADNDYAHEYPVTNGDAMNITSSHEQNDLAHSGKSSWQFRLQFGDEGTQPNSHWNTYEISVTTVKGLEIPVLPAHPDLWQGRTEYELFQSEDDVTVYYFTGASGSLDPIETQRPVEGALVPWDASEIVVELTATGQPPGAVHLSYQDPRSYDRHFPEGETSGDTTTYRIEVDGRGDSPYATQSQWEFRPFIDSGAGNLAYAWEGSIEMSAVVKA